LPDKVGSSFELSPLRPSLTLARHAKQKWGLEIAYPIEDILELEDEAKIAPKLDSHLSPPAYWSCFKQLAGRHFPDRLRAIEGQVSWRSISHAGDLAAMVPRSVSEKVLEPSFETEPREIFDSLKLYEHGSYSESACLLFNPHVVDGTAVIFGTSSARATLPYFAQCFRHVVQIWRNGFDLTTCLGVKPEFVGCLMTEKTAGNLRLVESPAPDAARIVATLAALRSHTRQ
jgi:hypothetical protein